MYFCFCDETGTGDGGDNLLILGVVVDIHRYGRTREQFGDLFQRCSETARSGLRELKGKELYRGSGRWFHVPLPQRVQIIDDIVQWVDARKHHIALAAIHVPTAAELSPPPDMPSDNWVRAALHIALQIQRSHQSKKGKGKTMLFLDQHARLGELSSLLLDPPPSTDDYYQRKRSAPSLSQVLDTAVSVQSHEFGLVQVADVCALILRRHCELADGAEPRWSDEEDNVDRWVETLTGRLLPKSHRWPSRSRSDLATWYGSVAPRPLLALG